MITGQKVCVSAQALKRESATTGSLPRKKSYNRGLVYELVRRICRELITNNRLSGAFFCHIYLQEKKQKMPNQPNF